MNENLVSKPILQASPYIHSMVIRKQLRDVLTLIAEIAFSDGDAPDTLIIDGMGLPEDEVRRYINELASLDLIKILPRMNRTADQKGREYRLINITKEGLQELSSDQDLR